MCGDSHEDIQKNTAISMPGLTAVPIETVGALLMQRPTLFITKV